MYNCLLYSHILNKGVVAGGEWTLSIPSPKWQGRREAGGIEKTGEEMDRKWKEVDGDIDRGRVEKMWTGEGLDRNMDRGRCWVDAGRLNRAVEKLEDDGRGDGEIMDRREAGQGLVHDKPFWFIRQQNKSLHSLHDALIQYYFAFVFT